MKNLSLLLLLFITSVTAQSLKEQCASDFNTNLQQEVGAGVFENREISSRDYKVSGSEVVKGLRDRPPSSYSIKMESFNTLLESANVEPYESRPFAVGGYNWTLVVYPNGNKKDSGSGYLSLYVAIDKSTLVDASKEVYADLRFYIYNKNERKYFTIQDTDVWKFNVFKTMWGFSQILPVDTFKDPKIGYLYDGDQCEFGVDVIVPSHFENYELFSATKSFPDPRYTWTIPGFSTLLKDKYLSEVFSIGGRNWCIQVHPNGVASVAGKYLSMFINLDANENFRPYEKIFLRAKLRIINQGKLSNIERKVDNLLNGPGYGPSFGKGFSEFVSLSDLKDSSKGLIVKDTLMVQVEIEVLSSTKYFPI